MLALEHLSQRGWQERIIEACKRPFYCARLITHSLGSKFNLEHSMIVHVIPRSRVAHGSWAEEREECGVVSAY